MKITISLGDIFLFIMIIAITLYAIWLPPSGEPAWLASSIDYIEQGQALWLAFVVLFIPYRCWRERLDAGDRRFWYWATLWWLTLLGRSISWGRVYFPPWATATLSWHRCPTDRRTATLATLLPVTSCHRRTLPSAPDPHMAPGGGSVGLRRCRRRRASTCACPPSPIQCEPLPRSD
ncbi:Uncharacterised protein [Edwardsiella tarda]|nr:Uncharacterised protein [Edwardsiella tarda]